MTSSLLYTLTLAMLVNHAPELPNTAVARAVVNSAIASIAPARVPLLVPAKVPLFGQPALTAHVGAPFAEAGGYDIVIGAIPNCEGSVCTFAELNAAPRALNVAERSGTRVALANGATGFYHEHPCGANCGGSSVLDFAFHGARYEISIKAGTLAEALAYQRGLELTAVKQTVRADTGFTRVFITESGKTTITIRQAAGAGWDKPGAPIGEYKQIDGPGGYLTNTGQDDPMGFYTRFKDTSGPERCVGRMHMYISDSGKQGYNSGTVWQIDGSVPGFRCPTIGNIIKLKAKQVSD